MSIGLEEALRAFFDEQAGRLAVRADEPYVYLQSELLLDELTDGLVSGQATFDDPPPADGAITGARRRRSIASGHGLRGRKIAITAASSGVFTAMIAVGLWRVQQPSPWRDEAVTLAVSRRSPGEIMNLAGHVDAVLTPYYLLMHFVTPAPHSLYAIRLVSVIVVALGAVCLVWLGVLVGGRWGLRVGGWAGVVYVADPLTSRYAQEARPYALAMLFAVLSACLLVKWLQTLSPRWLVLYLAATVMLGYAQLLGLLVVAAHAVTVALVRGWPASRRWLVAWVPGVCAIAPLGFFAWRQRVAMSWHTKPVSAQLQAVIDEFGGNEMGFHLLLLALALGLAVTYSATRRRGRSPSLALHVGAPWLLLPSCLLFAWSQASPMFSDRYVMFCVPALCLLAGTGLAFMPWPAAVALAGLFAHLLMPMQQQVRSTVGHSEDVRGVALAVAATAEPGDAVVFIPADRRVVEEAYPEDFDKAADVLLARPGAAAGSIAGTDVPPGGVPAAILSHERVIVVGTPAAANVGQVGRAAMEVLARHFQPLEHQQFAGFTFTLYARS